MFVQLLVAILVVGVSLVSATVSCNCECSLNQQAGASAADCSGCQAACSSKCIVLVGTTCVNDIGQAAASCFPAHSTVELENGSLQTMSNIKIGDKVLVAPNKYSEVYMFSHRSADSVSDFVKLETSVNTTLLLTADHYLYLNSKLAAARLAKVGDTLLTGDGSECLIVKVSSERATGLYNPHTLHGDIIVNGIKASSYTAAVAPTLAHGMLWPVRMLYALGYDILEGVLDDGSLWTPIAPRGQDIY